MNKILSLLFSLGIRVETLFPTRYGENPHQEGWLSVPITDYFEVVNTGKEPSYNNCVVDIEAIMLFMFDIVTHLLPRYDTSSQSVCIITKHGNACGLALRSNSMDAYMDARACDPTSAFGGVVAFNELVDISTVNVMKKHFMEVIIAPQFTEEAIERLVEVNPNRILLRYRNIEDFTHSVVVRTFFEHLAIQEPDEKVECFESFTQVSSLGVLDQKSKFDLELALLTAKHLKSNCVAFVHNLQLVGMGSGEVSRVDATEHAIAKARKFDFDLKGAVMASEAFFPQPDCVSRAAAEGITAVVHPGGSKQDNLTVDFCNANNIALYTNGVRHFKH